MRPIWAIPFVDSSVPLLSEKYRFGIMRPLWLWGSTFQGNCTLLEAFIREILQWCEDSSKFWSCKHTITIYKSERGLNTSEHNVAVKGAKLARNLWSAICAFLSIPWKYNVCFFQIETSTRNYYHWVIVDRYFFPTSVRRSFAVVTDPLSKFVLSIVIGI